MDFDILPSYTRTSSQTANDVFGNLYELVKTGTITLTGLSNEQLPVLPQALDGSSPLVEGRNCFDSTVVVNCRALMKVDRNVKRKLARERVDKSTFVTEFE